MNYLDELSKISDCTLYHNYDLSKATTFRLKSVGNYLEVKNIEALSLAIKILRKHGQKYLILGWGANQILPPKIQKLVIHLDFSFDMNELSEVKSEYHLPASIGLNHLSSHAVKFGLKGWEVFTGIPASLGGAIYMNAGTNLGEIGSLVKNVTLVNEDGEIRTEIIGANSFGYRKNFFVNDGDIIVGATLIHFGQDPIISQKIKDYMEFRRSSQPLATKNCGCVFKNPHKELPAGKLIDLLQLKGLGLAGLRVSLKHANFIENVGEANWNDFSTLIKLIQFEMDHFYGLEFELEVKIPYD